MTKEKNTDEFEKWLEAQLLLGNWDNTQLSDCIAQYQAFKASQTPILAFSGVVQHTDQSGRNWVRSDKNEIHIFATRSNRILPGQSVTVQILEDNNGNN